MVRGQHSIGSEAAELGCSTDIPVAEYHGNHSRAEAIGQLARRRNHFMGHFSECAVALLRDCENHRHVR
jgi:hypothetical protein